MSEVTIISALEARRDLRGNDTAEILEALSKLDYIATDPASGGFTKLDAEKLLLSERQKNIVRDLLAEQGMRQRQHSEIGSEGEERDWRPRKNRKRPANQGSLIMSWLKTIVEELRQKKWTRTVTGCPITVANHLHTMYVRQSYEDICAIMEATWKAEPSACFLLGGDSGLGKSLSVINLLAHIFLADPDHEVIWHHGPSQTFAYLTLKEDGFITKDSQILLDHSGFDSKLTVIVDGVRPDHVSARMVLVTSPPREVTKSFVGHFFPELLYLPEWSMEELKAALIAMKENTAQNMEKLEKMFLIWGGSPRFCIDKRHNATDFKLMNRSLQLTTTHHLKLLHLRDPPLELSTTLWRTAVDASYQPIRLHFASLYAKHETLQLFLGDQFLEIGNLLAAASDVHSIGCAVARRIVEDFCFALITAAPSVFCVSLSVKDDRIILPTPASKTVFSNLRSIDWETQSLKVPSISNLKTVDGFLDASTMLKVTCASTHDINADELVEASQVMAEKGPLRLVFVLPAPSAVDFKVGHVTAPALYSDAAVKACIDRLQLYALYIPLEAMVNRLQRQIDMKSSVERPSEVGDPGRPGAKVIERREAMLDEALDKATGKVSLSLPEALQSLSKPLGQPLRPSRLCIMPGSPAAPLQVANAPEFTGRQSSSLASTVQEVHDAFVDEARFNKLTVLQLQMFLKSMDQDTKGMKRDQLARKARTLLQELSDAQNE